MTKLKKASLIRLALVISITLTLGYEFQSVSVQGESDVPITAVPAGYGRYCSIRYSSGGWAFVTLGDAASDPCGAILKSSPGGTIERAGLWATGGKNNVLVRCNGDLRIYRDMGGKPTGQALAEAKGKKNCVFTVAPTNLPVFGLPYGKTTPLQSNPSSDVSIGRGFDYNVYRQAMNVADFGQQPNAAHLAAHSVDRTGKQRCRLGTQQECDKPETAVKEPAGCHIVPGEPAYDWPMPGGKPIVAVASGIVRGARWRDVTSYNCGADAQGEIYVEHQVGTGEYAERFVSYYAHVSQISVKVGDKVTRGQEIGKAGNTGCSGGNHLHLSVLRLTNLSGYRSYAFQTTPAGYGVNGIQGVIDPFGWAGPKHIDPWAWKFLGYQNDANSLKDPGAFSINLWRTGEAPPNVW